MRTVWMYVYINKYLLNVLSIFYNNSPDTFSPNPSWHGSVRYMGKWCTFQSILTIDGTNLCPTDTGARRGKIGSLRGMGRTILTNVKSVCAPLCAVEWLGPLWSAGRRLPKMEGRGVLWDFIPDAGNWYFPIFLLREGSLILMNMASLMVLETLCAFLATMEKLSTRCSTL